MSCVEIVGLSNFSVFHFIFYELSMGILEGYFWEFKFLNENVGSFGILALLVFLVGEIDFDTWISAMDFCLKNGIFPGEQSYWAFSCFLKEDPVALVEHSL